MEEKKIEEDTGKEERTEEAAGKEKLSMSHCVISKCQSPFLTAAISGLVASMMGIEEESIPYFKEKFTTLTTFNNLMLGFLACKYEQRLPTPDKKLPTEDEAQLPEASN